MSSPLMVLLLLILVPLAEIGVFIEVGGALGLWPTLALVVLTTIIGIACIRWQGFGLLRQTRAQLARNEPPVFEMVSGACLVLAGVLLILPGFVTDTAGFLLLLPPVRRLLFDKVLAPRMAVQASVHAAGGRRAGPHGQPHRRPGPPVVIEGEFEELAETKGEMPPPNGGWGGEMPPPRGGWGKPS